jgi:cysteine desulfurase / selenocysteine lyase
LLTDHDFPAALRSAVYLDSAATSWKPTSVLDALRAYDTEFVANVHRGAHALAERATAEYERAREDVAAFVGTDPKTVVFTSGATAAIQLVVAGLGLAPGDRVLVAEAEHHSNLVPWLRSTRAEALPCGPDGIVDLDRLRDALATTPRPRVIAVAWASHITGLVQPVRDIIALAHQYGVLVLLDAAQAAAHIPLDVDELGADFVAFSGHKMLGPTGIGVLTGARASLEALRPPFGGGGAVERVTWSETTFRPLPWRLEAGTPPIAQAIGLGAAVRYLDALGRERITAHARALAAELVAATRGAELLATSHAERDPLVTFRVPQLPVEGLARALADRFHIFVRAGTLCAQPGFERLGWPAGGVRASAHVYTTSADLAALAHALDTMQKALA